MKFIENRFVVAFLTTLLVGCNNTRVLEEEGPILPLPEHGYILFQAGVDARGILVEKEMPYDFGVFGYTYKGKWESEQTLATPNVFVDGNDNYVNVQKVAYDENNRLHSYDRKVAWLGTQNYSFFAYYPITDEDGNEVSFLTPSAIGHNGNPYVEYTLASRTDASRLPDVMTAHIVDTDASKQTVDFTMKHRLSAIDVIGRNFNDGISVEVLWLTIHFDNLYYDKVTIPLNSKDEPDLKYNDGDKKTGDDAHADYTLNSGIPVVVEADVTTETLLSEGKTMIVIPQTEYLSGSIDLTFKNEGGVSTEFSAPFNMNCEILPGRHYFIQLTFTQENVTIAIIQSEEWGDKSIDHEFE